MQYAVEYPEEAMVEMKPSSSSSSPMIQTIHMGVVQQFNPQVIVQANGNGGSSSRSPQLGSRHASPSSQNGHHHHQQQQAMSMMTNGDVGCKDLLVIDHSKEVVQKRKAVVLEVTQVYVIFIIIVVCLFV